MCNLCNQNGFVILSNSTRTLRIGEIREFLGIVRKENRATRQENGDVDENIV